MAVGFLHEVPAVSRPSAQRIAKIVTCGLSHLALWALLVAFSILAIRVGLYAKVDSSIVTTLFAGVTGWVLYHVPTRT